MIEYGFVQINHLPKNDKQYFLDIFDKQDEIREGFFGEDDYGPNA